MESFLFLAALFIVILALKLFSGLRLQSADQNELYSKTVALLSPAERSFFGALKMAVGEDVEIFSKVRVADVLKPIKGLSKSAWHQAFNRIKAKHFDFVLCDKSDMSVLCVIELNDKTHKQDGRRERDRFLLRSCDAAGLRIHFYPAQASYSVEELKNLFSPVAPNKQLQDVEKESAHSMRFCPKCSDIMVMRTAKKGVNVGMEFWACNSYPKCRHIEPV